MTMPGMTEPSGCSTPSVLNRGAQKTLQALAINIYQAPSQPRKEEGGGSIDSPGLDPIGGLASGPLFRYGNTKLCEIL